MNFNSPESCFPPLAANTSISGLDSLTNHCTLAFLLGGFNLWLQHSMMLPDGGNNG